MLINVILPCDGRKYSIKLVLPRSICLEFQGPRVISLSMIFSGVRERYDRGTFIFVAQRSNSQVSVLELRRGSHRECNRGRMVRRTGIELQLEYLPRVAYLTLAMNFKELETMDVILFWNHSEMLSVEDLWKQFTMDNANVSQRRLTRPSQD
jgi:hypothetical protein